MLIGLILIAFITLWVICFILFERDLVCPAMLLISGYTLSIGVAFVSDFTKPFVYHSETFFVLVVGTLLFLIPSYAFKCNYAESAKVNSSVARTAVDIRSFVLLLHAFCLAGVTVFIVWFYWRFLREQNPCITLSAAINGMRNFLIIHPEATALKEFFVLNQFKKVFWITSYFLLFVYARNVAIQRSFFSDKLLLINLFLSMVLFATDGGRGSIVAYVLAGISLWFLFDRLYNGSKLEITASLVLKVVSVFLAASLAFYALLYLTGRQTGRFDIAVFWNHISFYLGGSIPLLDNYLWMSLGGGHSPDFIGREVFYTLITQMSKLQLIDVPLYSAHLEFRPGVYQGNIYTAYRSYIHDFGWTGLLLLPCLFSVCANWLYYAAVRTAKKKIFAIGLIIYATLVYKIFADFVRCFFFLSFFDVNILVLIFALMILVWVLKKLNWMEFTCISSDGAIRENNPLLIDEIRVVCKTARIIRIPFTRSFLLLNRER